MPIIDHAGIRMPPPVDRLSERYLVSREHGAVSLTVKEVEIHPGWEGSLHTHQVDVSIQVDFGSSPSRTR